MQSLQSIHKDSDSVSIVTLVIDKSCYQNSYIKEVTTDHGTCITIHVEKMSKMNLLVQDNK